MQDQVLPLRLGVNVDHVATLRQARGTTYPSPLMAALIAQAAGADSITAHLREDRRHIQDADIRDLRSSLSVPLNLELSLDPEMVKIATQVRPQASCLVPERREELTTEGGLDVAGQKDRIADVVGALREVGSRVSLFVEPDVSALDVIVACNPHAVEIHTGRYADAADSSESNDQLLRIAEFAEQAQARGLEVHAGHGLTIENTTAIARIPQIQELNIGHALVADAVVMGMAAAVARMKSLMVHTRMSASSSPAPKAASYSAI